MHKQKSHESPHPQVRPFFGQCFVRIVHSPPSGVGSLDFKNKSTHSFLPSSLLVSQNVNKNVNINVNKNVDINVNENVNENVNINVNKNVNRNANENVNKNCQ